MAYAENGTNTLQCFYFSCMHMQLFFMHIHTNVFPEDENMKLSVVIVACGEGGRNVGISLLAVFYIHQTTVHPLSCFISCVLSSEAQLSEKISLQAIQQLVRKSYQALALWKLLCEHQFTVIVGELQKVRGVCPLGLFDTQSALVLTLITVVLRSLCVPDVVAQTFGPRT